MRPILYIRSEALRANLENLKHHLKHARNPRAELKPLVGDLSKIFRDLGEVEKKVSGVSIDLDSDVDPRSLVDSANDAHKSLKAARETLRKTNGEIEKIIARYARMQDDQVVVEIAKSLSEKTLPCIEQIDQVEEGLRLPGGNIQQLWTKYLDTADTANQGVFGAYIELLGGMALRDVGFDDGTSRLAEEVLRSCSTGKDLKPMVAIPTRQTAMTMTLGGVIRVTYPDWTLWALPSTAFEFWQEVAAEPKVLGPLQSKLRQITNSAEDKVEGRFRNCLGDAFATFTMGPAYACFAIYLLLNPSSPAQASDGQAADQVRAESIFQMLRLLDSDQSAAKNGLFGEIANDLEKVWNKAVEQAVQLPATPKDAATPEEKDKLQADKEKLEADKKQVEADRKRIPVLVDALWQALVENIAVPFSASVWADILKWVEPLQNGNINDIQLPAAPELRHVLNAAWLARVADNRKAKMESLTTSMGLLAEKIKNPMEGPQRVYAQRAL